MGLYQNVHSLVALRDTAFEASQDDQDRMNHELLLCQNNEVGVATWKDVKSRWVKAALYSKPIRRRTREGVRRTYWMSGYSTQSGVVMFS